MKTVNLTKLATGNCPSCAISPTVLEVYQKSLDYGDNWMIACSSGNIFLYSHGLNLLLKDLMFNYNLVRKFLRLIKYKHVAHILESFDSAGGNRLFWCCIEPLTSLGNCQILVIYFQPVNFAKGLKFISRNNVKNDLHLAKKSKDLDLSHLANEDKQILNLLRLGYTQQQISEKLATSRSSVVRKIIQICQKLGLPNCDTANLRKILNLSLNWSVF